jgi:hypothetical protein
MEKLMPTRFLLLAFLAIASTSTIAADQTYKGNGISFQYPTGFDISDHPKKDGSGSMIFGSNSRGTVSILITTIKQAVDGTTANNEQIQMESMLSGIKPDAWKPVKRKIGSSENEGKSAVTPQGHLKECYALKVGNQTIVITVGIDKGAEKDAEAPLKLILESLK